MSAVAELPRISVVVAAPPDDDGLPDCLASLAAVDYPPDRIQVLVMDSRRGVCVARNAGIAAASGEIVAFTDPDCAVTTGWLREVVAAFDGSGIGMVAGAIVPYPPRTMAERYAARRMSHSQLRPLAHPSARFAMTPNLAVRRDALEAVGGFDAALPGGGFEDADLCWRLERETALELRYAPRAIVLHRYRSTARDFLVQHHRYGRGLARLRRKFPARLAWGARERGRAYRGLAGAAARLVATAGRRGGRDDLALAGYDLLRHVGQRSGFLRGSLEPRPRRGRS